ncbi:MAG: hypothetical protein JNM07_03670 [Phycisphaerae bacterium]|nr:hypothetical protein [Phycisphaerae bacterium]
MAEPAAQPLRERRFDAGPQEPAPASYLRPYQRVIDREGATFDALLWTSRASQEARFAALSDMIDLRGAAVVDAGCGMGDFAAWLGARGVAYGHYTGVDALGALVAAAAERNLPRTSFLRGDFLVDPGLYGRLCPPAKAEIVVFSGSLNTLAFAQMLSALDGAWASCERALCFNVLSDIGPDAGRFASGPARAVRVASLTEWALDRTRLVSLRTDYLEGNDATIVMRKNRA